MSVKNERRSGAVDQVMFEKVIRDNITPEGDAIGGSHDRFPVPAVSLTMIRGRI